MTHAQTNRKEQQAWQRILRYTGDMLVLRSIGHTVAVVCIGIALFFTSCTSTPVAPSQKKTSSTSLLASSRPSWDETGATWHTIDIPFCSLATPPGKKLEIRSDAGEKLEISWVVGRMENGWLPGLRYEVYFYPPSDSPRRVQRHVIAGCFFPEGCNAARYRAADADQNGIPDRLLEVIWESWDFGADDGEPGYLDHVVQRYAAQTSRLTVTKHLYAYPKGCEPPVSYVPQVCDLKKECQPPYELVRQQVIVDKVMGRGF